MKRDSRGRLRTKAQSKQPQTNALPEPTRSHECSVCDCIHYEQSDEMETACMCGHAEEEHE